jgi:serine/threonine protein kinase
MVTELCDGTLFDMLHVARKQPDLPLLHHIALQSARGLAFLHSHHILHRDVKSLNLLLLHDGRCVPTHRPPARHHRAAHRVVKWCDMGLARSTKSTMEMVHTKVRRTFGTCGWPNRRCLAKVGTPTWMAPEVMREEPYTMRADVGSVGLCCKCESWSLDDASCAQTYSFGLVMYEMLCRQIPYANMSMFGLLQHVGMKGMRPPWVHGVPHEWRELVESCWAQDPDQRPSMNAVRGAFLSAAQCRCPALPRRSLLGWSSSSPPGTYKGVKTHAIQFAAVAAFELPGHGRRWVGAAQERGATASGTVSNSLERPQYRYEREARPPLAPLLGSPAPATV